MNNRRDRLIPLTPVAAAILRGERVGRRRRQIGVQLFERLLARLTPKQHALVRSALLEGGTRRQIADRFGIRHQTVTQQLAAADLTSIELTAQLIASSANGAES